MSERDCKEREIPSRGKPVGNFCWQHNLLYDIFQPIIGSYAVALYGNLSRRAYGDDAKFSYTVRDLSKGTGLSRSTVSRELRVLERMNMVRLGAGGGNQPSKCELLALDKTAESLGATRSKASKYVLHKDTSERLKAEVADLRRELQGNAPVERRAQTLPQQQSGPRSTPEQDASLPDSQRDANVTPERHQRYARETQTGPHLLKKNRKHENTLPPTPFPIENLWKSKDVPDEEKSNASLLHRRRGPSLAGGIGGLNL